MSGLRAIAWLKKLALPPAGPLALAVAGLWLPSPWGRLVTLCALLALWLAATPLVGLFLLRRLETVEALDVASFVADPSGPDSERDALVVLDGGRYLRRSGAGPESGGPESGGPESGGPENVKPETLERLAHAAYLHRATGLPILTSGDGAGPLMAEVLARDFRVETRWQEVESRNTQENADLSARLLLPLERRRVVLVTHAWHMPRSLRAFERAGFEVVPAPFAFSGPDRLEVRWLSMVPSAGGLLSTWRALHEWIGLAWYAWRYR